jgi:hypothetical protein
MRQSPVPGVGECLNYGWRKLDSHLGKNHVRQSSKLFHTKPTGPGSEESESVNRYIDHFSTPELLRANQ